jgi:PAS domain S-box-containing protein
VIHHSDLDRIVREKWTEILQRVGDAVLILDHRRILRYVNAPARRLLGYSEDQVVGHRCRLTTNGVDCENACPLTFALENDIERVEDFATVYQTKDGRSVPLSITVIPLRSDAGEFIGAVEILRPKAPETGFFLAGSSPAIQALKSRLVRHGRLGGHLIVVGERPACRDVGRAAHRLAGLPDELFHVWTGSWDGVPSFPPGSVYADGDTVSSLVRSDVPEGWRVIVGRVHDEPGVPSDLIADVVELPSIEEIRDDLDLMVAAWVEELAPGKRVSLGALRRFGRLACDNGLTALGESLTAAIAASDGTIEEEHLPTDRSGSHLVDELLETDNPLAALEGRLLTEVLHRSGWRMQEAADRLGVSRVTLWRKLKDHGIERPGCDDGSS